MSVLKCEKLTKNYGGSVALKDLDLTLESGKIYGLIGRNGAGKTTLLSIMSNQNPSTMGKVTLDGEDIWENRKAMERIVFSRELNPTPESGLTQYTVRRYLDIAAMLLPHWDKEMAKELVNRFGLDTKKKLGSLSKGMLSMVTIITALASKAEFTFLDEPVAGLDIVAREDFYRLLLEEFTETGRTFIISTHIIEEAADILEEVILLDHGKLLLHENTQELIGRAVYITGRADQVDGAVAGLECHRMETIGRSKGVTVLLKPGQEISGEYDVTIQPMSLQRLFVALCGEGAG